MCYTADPEFDQMIKTLTSLCNSFQFSENNVEKRITDVAVEQVVCVTQKIQITMRNPRSDGQVENAMKVIKDMLTAYVKDNQQDWNEHLPLIAQMFNSTINSATEMTPYYLVHGTEMNSADQE